MDIKKLVRILTWYANMSTQTVLHDWRADVVKEKMKECFDKVANTYELNWFDWNDLTEEDCIVMGFGRWTSIQEVKEENEGLPKELNDKTSEDTRKSIEEEIERNKRLVGLRLIPIWMFGLIPDGITLTDIGGSSFKFCKQVADKEHRFGCLAYGIYPKDAKRYEDYTEEDKQ